MQNPKIKRNPKPEIKFPSPMKTLLCALVLLAGCASFAASARQGTTNAPAASVNARPPPKFSEVVIQYFSQWDRNGDGLLSTDEINAAVVNPAFHGEAAAALAAIKLVVRGGKYTLPPITQAYLVASPLRESNQADVPVDLLDAPGQPKSIGHPPAFQPRYRGALARLRRVSRDLFPQDQIMLEACHQGPLGDCYLISVVGAMVCRDPAAVKGMFMPNLDGSTTVALGNGRRVNVAPLTDAEIAISSIAGTNGLWLTVLENAYGKYRQESLPNVMGDDPETDVIAHGGNPGYVMTVLDGHQARSFALVTAKGRRQDPQFTTNLAQNLTAAQQAHRLAEATTGTNALPPGINSKHAYAILGFNRDTGVVHIWNPHGNKFTPKGPDGIQYGYTTQAGQFDIPLKDLLQVYSRVIIESPTPAAPPKPAPARTTLKPSGSNCGSAF